MNAQFIIFCIVVYAFQATNAHHQDWGHGRPRCSEKSVTYWRGKFYNGYSGDDEPEIRCDKESGYCMREGDCCESKDWIRWQTSCYDTCYCCFYKARTESSMYDWYLHEERKTWRKAKAYCEEKDGSLLVPENIADIIDFMREKGIGTYDVWVGIKEVHGRYEGIDGNYIHNGWQIGQPRGTDEGGENCVALENDPAEKPGMKVEPCYAENYFFCDYQKHYKKGHNIYIDDMYNMNEIESDRYGFKSYSGVYGKTIVIEDFRRTWKEARDRCKDRGGDLLVPPKIGHLVEYIRDLKLGEHDIWIGYRGSGKSGFETSFDGIHGNRILDGWQPREPREHDTPGCVAVEDHLDNGAGLKVEPCEELHLYACDLSTDNQDHHNTEM